MASAPDAGLLYPEDLSASLEKPAALPSTLLHDIASLVAHPTTFLPKIAGVGLSKKAVRDLNGRLTAGCSACIATLDKESAAQTTAEGEHKRAEALADADTNAARAYEAAEKAATAQRAVKSKRDSELTPLSDEVARIGGLLKAAEAAAAKKKVQIAAAIAASKKALGPLEATEASTKKAEAAAAAAYGVQRGVMAEVDQALASAQQDRGDSPPQTSPIPIPPPTPTPHPIPPPTITPRVRAHTCSRRVHGHRPR